MVKEPYINIFNLHDKSITGYVLGKARRSLSLHTFSVLHVLALSAVTPFVTVLHAALAKYVP